MKYGKFKYSRGEYLKAIEMLRKAVALTIFWSTLTLGSLTIVSKAEEISGALTPVVGVEPVDLVLSMVLVIVFLFFALTFLRSMIWIIYVISFLIALPFRFLRRIVSRGRLRPLDYEDDLSRRRGICCEGEEEKAVEVTLFGSSL